VELIQDSGGAGQYRGGLGVNLEFTMLEDSYATTVCERSKFPPWGLNGGREGLTNNCFLLDENEKSVEVPKATRVPITKGKRILLQCGGGGGYGDPKEREHTKVLDDLKQGYISKKYVKKHYPNVTLE
jgi:N-methylhydantoinase B